MLTDDGAEEDDSVYAIAHTPPHSSPSRISAECDGMIGIADGTAASAAGKTQLAVEQTAPLPIQRTAGPTVRLTAWPAAQPMTQPTWWRGQRRR